jgi:hypothetical protein
MEKVNSWVFGPQSLYDWVTYLKDFQPVAYERMMENGLNRETLNKYLEEFCLSIPQNESAYSLIQKKEHWRKQSLTAHLINYVIENKLLPRVWLNVSKYWTSQTIWNIMLNPYSADEFVNEDWDVVNPADIRGGVVSIEDLNYHLSKYK